MYPSNCKRIEVRQTGGSWGSRHGSSLLEVYRAAGLDVTAKIYPDARHETLNEVNRGEVTRELIAWLAATLAGK